MVLRDESRIQLTPLAGDDGNSGTPLGSVERPSVKWTRLYWRDHFGPLMATRLAARGFPPDGLAQCDGSGFSGRRSDAGQRLKSGRAGLYAGFPRQALWPVGVPGGTG